jgi:hypothetical protein
MPDRYSIKKNKENGLFNVYFGTMYCFTYDTYQEAKDHIQNMKKRYKNE